MSDHAPDLITGNCLECSAKRTEIEDGLAPADCWGHAGWRIAWRWCRVPAAAAREHGQRIKELEDRALEAQLAAVLARGQAADWQRQCQAANERGNDLARALRTVTLEAAYLKAQTDALWRAFRKAADELAATRNQSPPPVPHPGAALARALKVT